MESIIILVEKNTRRKHNNTRRKNTRRKNTRRKNTRRNRYQEGGSFLSNITTPPLKSDTYLKVGEGWLSGANEERWGSYTNIIYQWIES